MASSEGHGASKQGFFRAFFLAPPGSSKKLGLLLAGSPQIYMKKMRQKTGYGRLHMVHSGRQRTKFLSIVNMTFSKFITF
jgi:hypothetical protein